MKKLIVWMVTIFLIGISITPSITKAEEWPKAKCQMTIKKSNNSSKNPAHPDGICKDLISGYYSEAIDEFFISGMANYTVEKSGQVFTIGVPSGKYLEADLTVYLDRTNPKPTPTPTPTKPATLKTLYKANVTASSLNVRSSNSTKSKVIGSLKKNATVEVVQTSGSWSKIKYKSGYGWVSSSYIKKVTVTPVVKVLYKANVTSSSLNVMSSNSTKSKKLGSLKKNATVEVVQTSGSWSKIKYKSGYGWVSSKNVKKVSVTPTVKILYKAKVTSSSLNVMSSNSTKSKKLGSLKKNSTVEVVQTSGSWSKIKYKSGYGWVSSKSVKKVSATPTVKVLYKGKVTATSLKVRSTNSTKGKVLGSLKKNSTVEVVQTKSGWSKIKYKTTYGWVSGKYIKKVK